MPNPNSKLMAWLQLFRVANLPSAIANILMGFLLVHHSWTPTIELILLIVASSSMYLAGMVLNDVFDFEIDLQQRPSRPLPSNKISKGTAALVGSLMLVAGIGIAIAAGAIAAGGLTIDLYGPLVRTGLISVALAICVVLYDGPLKRTIAAPFIMGSCRSLNILMGASTFAPAVMKTSDTSELILGLPPTIWWVAISIGLLISGATLLGRKEAVENQNRTPLFVAVGIIISSLIAFGLVVYIPSDSIGSIRISEQQKTIFALACAMLSITIVRRAIEAAATAQPKKIQMGVVSVLRSLIIFDAMICYIAMPDQVIYSLVVLALLIPSFLMGRFFRST
ncbi:MAG: UbiA family prenyltransferase [Mariniblastus sp.]